MIPTTQKVVKSASIIKTPEMFMYMPEKIMMAAQANCPISLNKGDIINESSINPTKKPKLEVPTKAKSSLLEILCSKGSIKWEQTESKNKIKNINPPMAGFACDAHLTKFSFPFLYVCQRFLKTLATHTQLKKKK